MKRSVEKYTEFETVPLWVGNRAVQATSTRNGEVTNPATGAVIRYVPMSNVVDVDRAVKAAEAA